MGPNKTTRCLRLLRALHARGSLTTVEAARVLGVDREAALRDLVTVAEVVPELVRRGEGRDRQWWLAPRDGPLFTFGERLALHFGRQLMSFLAGTLLPEWLDELREKLEPESARGADTKVERLAARFHYVTEPFRSYEAHDRTIEALMKALLENREVAIDYAGGRGYERFQPYTIVVYRRALYLLGHPVGGEEYATLAVDRVRSLTLSERTFRLPKDYEPGAASKDYLGIWRNPPPERVVLRFPASKRGLLEARTWHPSAVIREAPDGRVELELHAGGKELVNLALEWGRACEVIEPPWLRAEVVAELRGALERYSLPNPERPHEPP